MLRPCLDGPQGRDEPDQRRDAGDGGGERVRGQFDEGKAVTVTAIATDIAADFEQLTRVKDKDIRVFQDGVYISGKPNRGEA